MEPLSHDGPPLFKRPLCPKCFLSDVHANEPLTRITPLLSGPLFNWGLRREIWLYWITFYTHKKTMLSEACPPTPPPHPTPSPSLFASVNRTISTHASAQFTVCNLLTRALTFSFRESRSVSPSAIDLVDFGGTSHSGIWMQEDVWEVSTTSWVKGHMSWAQIKECCWCLESGESLPAPSPQWDSIGVNVKGPSTKTLELWKALSLNSGAGLE